MFFKNYPSDVNEIERDDQLLDQLKSSGVLDFPGGIPNSLIKSGEQWDFPNAWPPSVQMIVIGLANSKSVQCQEEAFKQAEKVETYTILEEVFNSES